MAANADQQDRLVEAVGAAFAERLPLQIAGSGSKVFLTEPGTSRGRADVGRLLSVAEHSGVTEYRPEELVVTARAGTTLKELEQQLARERQMLPFEPPRFSGAGTLGGAIASGLSGPGRPWYGSLRDAVLGVEMINGRGEFLRFGGQVMKNVAGYDVSRLQAGAFGTLGVLLSASIKILPKPVHELTCVIALEAEIALERLREWARLPLPITATCHVDGQLRVRLSGAESAVVWAAGHIGGDVVHAEPFWSQVRNHEIDFFKREGTLWRLSLPPNSLLTDEPTLIEWGGALRWVRSEQAMFDWARQQGGYALPFNGDYSTQYFLQVDRGLRKRIKKAFDPAEVLNPLTDVVPDAN
ncbi:MAG: glycolate oxidase subunit GlcE [Gammaproteobacteria bacterium]|nr:glycolate oxidase subunit GlcE [Gammaproteobacteria bacterium]